MRNVLNLLPYLKSWRIWMKILVKLLSPEVKTLSGWIVYVMDDNDNPIEAEVCELESLVETVRGFESKYEI
jgi:hypothetical protein